MNITEIKKQILDLFPVNSEWYDCVADCIGTVKLHFEPRGIFIHFEQVGGLTHYGYTDLLSGRLYPVTDCPPNLVACWQDRQKKIVQDFKALVGDQTVWGPPA